MYNTNNRAIQVEYHFETDMKGVIAINKINSATNSDKVIQFLKISKRCGALGEL